jgi:hypothetical protein
MKARHPTMMHDLVDQMWTGRESISGISPLLGSSRKNMQLGGAKLIFSFIFFEALQQTHLALRYMKDSEDTVAALFRKNSAHLGFDDPE